MVKRFFELYIVLLLSSTVFLSFLFLKPDFNNFDYIAQLSSGSDVCDLFYILDIPSLLLYLVILQILLMLYMWKPYYSKILVPLSISSVFLIVYPIIAQYPALKDDTIYHAFSSKIIFEDGRIPFKGYTQYPGTFLMLGTLSHIMSIEYVEGALFLNGVLQFLFIICLYVLGVRAVGKQHGYLVPTVYLVLTPLHLGNMQHFSPQLFSLNLMVITLYLLLLRRNGVKSIVPIMILIFAVIISHVTSGYFLSFAILTFSVLLKFILKSFGIPEKLNFSTGLALFSLGIWFLWFIYAGSFEYDLLRLLNAMFTYETHSREYLNTWIRPLLPIRTDIISNSLFLIKLILQAFNFSAILFYVIYESKKRTISNITGSVLGVLVSSFFVLPFLGMLIVMPFALYLSVFSCISTVRLIKLSPKISHVFPIICIALVTISFFAANYRMEYTYTIYVQPWETEVFSHIWKYQPHQVQVQTDGVTAINYAYYNPSAKEYPSSINPEASPETFYRRLNMTSTFFEGEMIIRTIFQELHFFTVTALPKSFWETVDRNLQGSPEYNVVFSSGYIQIYAKSMPA